MENFNLTFENDLFLIRTKEKLNLTILEEIRNSLPRTFRFAMYKDSLGYHHCYDFVKDNYVYCGSMNYKEALSLVTKYKEEND